MTQVNSRYKLKQYLAKTCIIESDEPFILNSGEESTLYFDKYRAFGNSGALNQICLQFSNLLSSYDDADIHGLFAPALGGAMFASALQMFVHTQFKMNLSLSVVRTEEKDHGTRNSIEGYYAHGANIVIIEDVITSGKSVHHVLDTIFDQNKQKQVYINQILCLVDRGGSGVKSLRERGYDVSSLFTFDELQSS